MLCVGHYCLTNTTTITATLHSVSHVNNIGLSVVHPSIQPSKPHQTCLLAILFTVLVYMYISTWNRTRATMDMRVSEWARSRIDRRIFGPKVFFRAFFHVRHLATTCQCCRQLGRLVIFIFFLSFSPSLRVHTQPHVPYMRTHILHTHTHTNRILRSDTHSIVTHCVAPQMLSPKQDIFLLFSPYTARRKKGGSAYYANMICVKARARAAQRLVLGAQQNGANNSPIATRTHTRGK